MTKCINVDALCEGRVSNGSVDIDTFGEIMDKYLTDNRVWMFIDMPEGTQKAKIIGTGVATIDFYMLLSAARTTFDQMIDELGGVEVFDKEGLVDELLKMLRGELLEDGDEQ